MSHVYDNEFGDDNVYGHVLHLLEQFGAKQGVHLDLGCGFGNIARPLRQRTGLEYLGIDGAPEGVAKLSARGFEAHVHTFGDPERDLAFLRERIGSRQIASISLIDVLEHAPSAEALLEMASQLAEKHRALLVVSVPNVTHRDLGLKLMFGRWDYTPAGLLDWTHVRFFSDAELARLTRSMGWIQVGARDVELQSSDQRFPVDHPALVEQSLLHQHLVALRSQVDGWSTVNQFVRAYLPGPRHVDATATEKREVFLSIVTRTQGKRLSCLREVFLCLAGQHCKDFEVLVVGHKLTPPARLAVEQLIADLPDWLRTKVRLVLVEHGNRTAPLNVGFAEARGQYISVLDDDDLVFANWVETFKSLADQYAGRVLHSIGLRQEFDLLEAPDGTEQARAVSGMKNDYGAGFDLLRQLKENRCPPVSLAFPAAAFQDLGIRFDETLTTTEDWDYLMRVAFVCGVGWTEEVTGIYRWWLRGESSRTDHAEEEWRANYNRILDKFDSTPILLPPGSARRLRALADENEHLRRRLGLHVEVESVPLSPTEAAKARKRELALLVSSGSWRVTAPIRAAAKLMKREVTSVPPVETSEPEDVAEAIAMIRQSTSWRLSSPLRWIKDELPNRVPGLQRFTKR